MNLISTVLCRLFQNSCVFFLRKAVLKREGFTATELDYAGYTGEKMPEGAG